MRGTITKIERQHRNVHRYNIYVDGDYATSVHEDVLIKCHIHKGQHVEEDDWKQLLIEEETNQARQKALKWLSYKARTEREVFRYLEEQRFTRQRVKEVVSWLKKYEFVDDAAYAKAWVNSRRHLKGWSKRRLRQELMHKGIDEQWIDEALSTLSEEEEFALARQWAFKRYKLLQNEDWKTIERRIGAYLARRGFQWDDIASVMRNLRQHHRRND